MASLLFAGRPLPADIPTLEAWLDVFRQKLLDIPPVTVRAADLKERVLGHFVPRSWTIEMDRLWLRRRSLADSLSTLLHEGMHAFQHRRWSDVTDCHDERFQS